MLLFAAMHSWTIFRNLPHLWGFAEDMHPVFLRETLVPPSWHNTVARFGRWLLFPGGLVVTSGFVFALMALPASSGPAMLTVALCALSPAMLIAPSLGIWVILLGLALGPVIAREREHHTWDLLRLTSLNMDDLILHKMRGGLWWLRGALRAMQVMMLLVALGVLLVALDQPISYSASIGWTMEPLSRRVLDVTLATAGALLFLLDRAQQFTLMALAALVGGAAQAEHRSALLAALASAFAAWLGDLLVTSAAMVVLALKTGRSAGLLALWIGPAGSYLVSVALPLALILTLITLAARELAVRWLWARAVRLVG